MSPPTKDVDAYLASVPEEQRAALQKLRTQIKDAAPAATETISYQIPTFRLHGGLVAFSAHDNHCSLHLMSTALMDAIREDLKSYSTTKATIRFSPGKPLPDALVTKLVKARIAENEAART